MAGPMSTDISLAKHMQNMSSAAPGVDSSARSAYPYNSDFKDNTADGVPITSTLKQKPSY